MKTKRLLWLLILTLAPGLTIAAQQLLWDVDFRTIFDNREGDHTYNDTRTFFQTQLAPEIGISIANEHQFAVGAVWTQPVENSFRNATIKPTIYYRLNKPTLKFAFGIFPRAHLLEQMPEYLWSDSLNYANPNLTGTMIGYRDDKGYFEAFLDWRGFQSRTVREAFSIQAQGEFAPEGKIFMTGGTAMLNHLAKSSNKEVTEYVNDNIVANPWVGLNFNHLTPLETLQLRVGALMSTTRHRCYNNWHHTAGVLVDARVAWRWLSVKDVFYAGNSMYPFYNEYGPLLDMGEPFFQSPYYNRTEMTGRLLGNDFVNLEASLVFNVAKDCFNFYQRLSLRFYFGSERLAARKNGTRMPQVENLY